MHCELKFSTDSTEELARVAAAVAMATGRGVEADTAADGVECGSAPGEGLVAGLPKPERVDVRQWWLCDYGDPKTWCPFRVNRMTERAAHGLSRAGIDHSGMTADMLTDRRWRYLGNGERPVEPRATKVASDMSPRALRLLAAAFSRHGGAMLQAAPPAQGELHARLLGQATAWVDAGAALARHTRGEAFEPEMPDSEAAPASPAKAPPIPGPTALDGVVGMLVRAGWDDAASELADGELSVEEAAARIRRGGSTWGRGPERPDDATCLSALEALAAREACRAGHGVDDACAECAPGEQAPMAVGPHFRERLGMVVRDVWISWAREQPNPKPSWLAPWADLSEPDREVDRRIGEQLFQMGRVAGSAEARPAGDGAAEVDALRKRLAELEVEHAALKAQIQSAREELGARGFEPLVVAARRVADALTQELGGEARRRAVAEAREQGAAEMRESAVRDLETIAKNDVSGLCASMVRRIRALPLDGVSPAAPGLSAEDAEALRAGTWRTLDDGRWVGPIHGGVFDPRTAMGLRVLREKAAELRSLKAPPVAQGAPVPPAAAPPDLSEPTPTDAVAGMLLRHMFPRSADMLVRGGWAPADLAAEMRHPSPDASRRACIAALEALARGDLRGARDHQDLLSAIERLTSERDAFRMSTEEGSEIAACLRLDIEGLTIERDEARAEAAALRAQSAKAPPAEDWTAIGPDGRRSLEFKRLCGIIDEILMKGDARMSTGRILLALASEGLAPRAEAPPTDPGKPPTGEPGPDSDLLAEHLNAAVERDEASAIERAHADGIVEGLMRAREVARRLAEMCRTGTIDAREAAEEIDKSIGYAMAGIKSDGGPDGGKREPCADVPPPVASSVDWTAGPTGEPNTSELFEKLAAVIDGCIALVATRPAHHVARFTLAKLAHLHGLAPRDAATVPQHVAPDREALGREVHHAWAREWAADGIAPAPKRWDELVDRDCDVSCRIGERLFNMGVQHAQSGAAERRNQDADLLAALRVYEAHDASGNPHMELPADELAGRVYRLGVTAAGVERDGARHVATVLLGVIERQGEAKRAGRARMAIPRLFPVTPGPLAELADRIASVFVDAFAEPSDGELRAMPAAARVLGMVDEHLRGGAAPRANGVAPVGAALIGLDAGGGL